MSSAQNTNQSTFCIEICIKCCGLFICCLPTLYFICFTLFINRSVSFQAVELASTNGGREARVACRVQPTARLLTLEPSSVFASVATTDMSMTTSLCHVHVCISIRCSKFFNLPSIVNTYLKLNLCLLLVLEHLLNSIPDEKPMTINSLTIFL